MEHVTLVELRLRDFGTIDSATIAFGPGLNVLTGEAGVVRTILIDALHTAFGGRTTGDLIRPRAGSARVEARFAVDPNSAAGRWLRDQGLSGREVVVVGDVAAGGRAQAWINDRPATAEVQGQAAQYLVEVIGSSQGRLQRPATHLDLLDAFAGPAVQKLRAEVAEQVSGWAELHARLQAAMASERERARQQDLLAHQVWEIDGARLQPGEDQALLQRRTRLANAERLIQASAAAYAALSQSDGQAATDQLGRALDALREAAGLDPALSRTVERLDALAQAAAAIGRELMEYVQTVEVNTGDLELVDERLATIGRLQRRYGPTVDAILAARAEAAASLEGLNASPVPSAQIAQALRDLERDLGPRLERLSVLRQAAATALEDEAGQALQTLGMGGRRLTMALSREPAEDGVLVAGQRVAVSPAGADRAELLLASNPQDTPRPLSASVSADEIARLTLVLQGILPDPGGSPVLVYEAVGASLGGSAGSIGRLISAASGSRQVICVAHSADVVSLADRHIHVRARKEAVWGRPRIEVQALEGQERVDELARMLGEKMPASAAQESAAKLLEQASQRRRRATGSGSS